MLTDIAIRKVLGGRPVAELVPADVLDLLRRVERRGTVETAHRLRDNIGKPCATRSPPGEPREISPFPAL